MKDRGGRPRDAARDALIAEGLPHALQVARRVARASRVLDLPELEAVARAALPEIVGAFDAERGDYKSFVCARVGFALFKALRRERRAAVVEVDAAVRAGLAHVEAMEAAVDPLSGSDEEAYLRLVDVAAEVADVLVLHVDREGTSGIVQAAIARLPRFEGDVVRLHYLEGKSFRQIGAELGCTYARAYRAHERALPRLRRRLHGIVDPPDVE